MTYWFSPVRNLVYVISPLLFAVAGIPLFLCSLSELLLFWLPMFIAQYLCFRLISGNTLSTKWSGIQETSVMPYSVLHRINKCKQAKEKGELTTEDKKMLNENELNQVNGGLGGRVCIKDLSNRSANQSFCSGCSKVRRDGSYSGNGYDCSCSNGILGTWKE